MGRRIILSESEKLNIQNLYKGLLSEQSDNPQSDQPIKDDLPKKEVPVRKYLPIADDFCQVLNGTGQLKRGAKGDLVELFQEALNSCGIEPLQQLEVDGDFGSKTKDAVELFQEKNGLTVDGGIGPETSGKLCELGCIPKEICTKCEGDENTEKRPTSKQFRKGAINVECEKVQGCISEFMSEFQGDQCLDEDMLRKLLNCVGIGQCFEGGEVTTVKEGCTGRNGVDLCSVPFKQLERGGNYTANIGYFYDPKSNSCVSRSMGGGPFSQEEKCVQCCVRK